ncbi:MAG TPA: DUF484 family protein [Marinospirillum sp.]|uniref:DUF484 family protein n=1 Tax=Marinospirillum sp. TaxID=2183934 RepID=UPI002B486917|nr:DUF484 family protein [Marinospirillum sp.]HKM14508.1 DUF484 family protein [Marinospirillum sp.]
MNSVTPDTTHKNTLSQLLTLEQISAEQVAAWLNQNRHFFIGREQLLTSLALAHDCGSAESLLLYQIKNLREKLNQQKQDHEQLLNNARDNEKRLKRIERLLVKLLEAESTEELTALLKEELQHNFALPYLAIWSHNKINGLPEASEEQQQQQLALLAKKRLTSLQLNATTAALLGLDNLQQGSAIICRLNHTNHLGVLVFAHPSSNHFRQQDTLFVEYLATIVSSLIHRHQAHQVKTHQ